jgi:hypothetical protein
MGPDAVNHQSQQQENQARAQITVLAGFCQGCGTGDHAA